MFLINYLQIAITFNIANFHINLMFLINYYLQYSDVIFHCGEIKREKQSVLTSFLPVHTKRRAVQTKIELCTTNKEMHHNLNVAFPGCQKILDIPNVQIDNVELRVDNDLLHRESNLGQI